MVLNIPIFEHHDDFIAWQFDNKGLFSVRSAYRVHTEMLQRQCTRQRGESSTEEEEERTMWQQLWKVRCPGKIHHFLWRLAHNSHPLLRNVERIGVELDTGCVVCHRLQEDGGHLFFRCKEVRKMWRACGLEETRQKLLPCHSPRQVLIRILSLPDEEKLNTICLLWLWWTERNKANHQVQRATEQEFSFMLSKHITEWRQFYAKPEKSLTKKKSLWSKPAMNFVKINVDGSFEPNSQLAGWGCIARDHTGDVLFTAAGNLVNMSEALHAEACALLHAIKMAEEHGMGRVVFETDCAGLQQAMTTSTLDRSPLGTLFREIKFLLSLGFIEWNVSFCPRSCNVPAHELAAIGRRDVNGGHHMWLVNPPKVVTDAVTADLAGPR